VHLANHNPNTTSEVASLNNVEQNGLSSDEHDLFVAQSLGLDFQDCI
jgi:hypothetical protein